MFSPFRRTRKHTTVGRIRRGAPHRMIGFAAVGTAALLGGAALAQTYREDSIRTEWSQSIVEFFAGHPGNFSITVPRDAWHARATLRWPNGAVLSDRSLQEIRQSLTPLVLTGVVYHTDGRMSLRLRLNNPQYALDYGTVEVLLNGRQLDIDRIRVY